MLTTNETIKAVGSKYTQKNVQALGVMSVVMRNKYIFGVVYFLHRLEINETIDTVIYNTLVFHPSSHVRKLLVPNAWVKLRKNSVAYCSVPEGLLGEGTLQPYNLQTGQPGLHHI